MTRRVKISVEVPESIVGEVVETMWAEEVTSGYRLLNSPWYAKGISYLDIIEAIPTSDGMLRLARKVATAGHSTYRLLIAGDYGWKPHWARLETLGCTYEESRHESFNLLAVDVPPECDIHSAYALMEAAENEGAWEFEEGDVNHPISSSH